MGARASSARPSFDRVLTDARARIAAVPTAVLLGGLVTISFAYRLYYALRDPAPWIFHDELAYSELAKAVGSTGEFAIRGVDGTHGLGIGYPILIAPAYALFDSIPAAYDVVKGINCLLMSLTVVPVYLIARRVAPRYLALLASGLAVALPPLMYTRTVMTENAFYPMVALWAYALLRALERPTLLRQLLVLALLGAAFLIRVQAIVLGPALVTTVAVVVILDALAERNGTFGRRLWASAVRF